MREYIENKMKTKIIMKETQIIFSCDRQSGRYYRLC